MILTPDEIEKAKLAGKIAGKALNYGISVIRPGESVVECLDKIEAHILKTGGGIAFPVQVSINSTAAHFCPLSNSDLHFKSNDIIKLDLGVHIDGYIGDTAYTILFSDNENYEQYSAIKNASDEALKNALALIQPGVTLGELGLMIQETIAKYDLSPIRNLSGHGLGKYLVHTSPTIPNFNTNDKTALQENQHIAIEPFSTNGQGMVFESSNPTIFSLNHIKPVRSPLTREVLRDIEKYRGLPFTTRWLTQHHSLAKLNFAFSELKRLGCLHEYPPLIEARHGVVSQTEHTVIVREKPIITTARED